MVLVNNFPDNEKTEDLKTLVLKTIRDNPYIPYNPYTEQLRAILYASRVNNYKFNQLLVGAGGFGGKTFLGSMLAVQHLLTEPDYTCIVTRRNYAELIDTNSVWDNLISWCCDASLGDYQCEFKKSPTPTITDPINGNTIYFKSFDRAEKKQKFKSASYDRIINDEASELPVDVLKFQYRSLRNTSDIPLSIINLSNPGGESTQYLVDKFVDGANPYIAMDWRHNPYINKQNYSESLDELDYIDQQYQKYGNWHYRPSQGDLISIDELQNSYINFEDYMNRTVHYCTIGIDLAGKGRDNTAIASLILLDNGLLVCNDLRIENSSYPEDMIYDTIETQSIKNSLYKVTFEAEPGSDNVYSLRYWTQDVLQDLIYKYGLIVDSMSPSTNKFTRARPLAKAIKNKELLFDISLKELLERPNGLFEQFISVSPNPEVMKKQKSPDELDALGYAYAPLKEVIGASVTAY